MSGPWTCPYCNRKCTVGDNDIRVLSSSIWISEDYGYYNSRTIIITCPNPECRKQAISLKISNYDNDYHKIKDLIHEWQLLPESEAKPFPDYIPEQLRSDYFQSCLIRNKSPKASATLSRRCLQGMIRDYWKISKSRLIDEINELQSLVDNDTWKAIDSVRKVGNIGAHMEKDVNVIIDVEPEESGLLIWLIETLFEEWYIARHEKQLKMDKIVQISQNKLNQKPKTP
jgi:hypothetical protein